MHMHEDQHFLQGSKPLYQNTPEKKARVVGGAKAEGWGRVTTCAKPQHCLYKRWAMQKNGRGIQELCDALVMFQLPWTFWFLSGAETLQQVCSLWSLVLVLSRAVFGTWRFFPNDARKNSLNISIHLICMRAFPMAQQQRICLPIRRCQFNPWVGNIPWKRKGNPFQYSCLGNPMDRGASWDTVHGAAQSQT